MSTSLNPNVKSAGQYSTRSLESWKIRQVDKRVVSSNTRLGLFFKVKQIKTSGVTDIAGAMCYSVNINLWTIADVVNIGSTDEFVVLEF